MTLWSARTGGGGLAPEVWDFLRADDRELLAYDCEATLVHARRLHAAGLLTEAELALAETGLAEIGAGGEASAERRGRPLDDRAPARRGRPQDPRRPLAQRPGRRRVSPLRRGRVPRGDRRHRVLRRRRPRARRPRSGDADARLHASAAGAAGDDGPPPARLGRDAGPGPGPLPLRRRGSAGQPAGRRGARRFDTRPPGSSRRR